VWYKAPTVLPAGDQDEVELVITSSVELIEIINKIINVASSWRFMYLYQ